MNEKISLINKRGRIVWSSKRDLKESLAKGMRIFPNPRQEYYPEYDQEFNKEAINEPLPQESTGGKKLDVLVL